MGLAELRDAIKCMDAQDLLRSGFLQTHPAHCWSGIAGRTSGCGLRICYSPRLDIAGASSSPLLAASHRAEKLQVQS
jgi:hypothetical protein